MCLNFLAAAAIQGKKLQVLSSDLERLGGGKKNLEELED